MIVMIRLAWEFARFVVEEAEEMPMVAFLSVVGFAIMAARALVPIAILATILSWTLM